MKILMVSMQSLHFFSWTEQLKNTGHEIYWFDAMDFEKKVEKLNWLHQITNWKRKFNYPGKTFLKNNFPKLFSIVNKINNNKIDTVFEKKLLEIKPDIVHSFAMQISCIPILNIMIKYPKVKWMYSSWGSDMYFSDYLNIDKNKMTLALSRIDYLITDCNRDYHIALQKGFTNTFLGVFPGNGGVNFVDSSQNERNIILIKGYNQKVSKGLQIIQAIDGELIKVLNKFQVIVYGADETILDYIKSNERFNILNIKVFTKRQYINNEELLNIMSKSYIHIANSVSDGLPNSLIEAMGMGAFPIQSNPGNVTTELITHKKNGLLINNPENVNEITELLKFCFTNPDMINLAKTYNINFINERYNRNNLKDKITKLYE